MSIVEIDSEVVADIKNALCIIQLNADLIMGCYVKRMKHLGHTELNTITKQVKRINGMLPEIAFEAGIK